MHMEALGCSNMLFCTKLSVWIIGVVMLHKKPQRADPHAARPFFSFFYGWGWRGSDRTFHLMAAVPWNIKLHFHSIHMI